MFSFVTSIFICGNSGSCIMSTIIIMIGVKKNHYEPKSNQDDPCGLQGNHPMTQCPDQYNISIDIGNNFEPINIWSPIGNAAPVWTVQPTGQPTGWQRPPTWFHAVPATDRTNTQHNNAIVPIICHMYRLQMTPSNPWAKIWKIARIANLMSEL